MGLVKCLKKKANKGSKPCLPSGGIKFTLKKENQGRHSPCLSGANCCRVQQKPCSFLFAILSTVFLATSTLIREAAPWLTGPPGHQVCPCAHDYPLESCPRHFSLCLICVLSAYLPPSLWKWQGTVYFNHFILWTFGHKNTNSFSKNDLFILILLSWTFLPTYSCVPCGCSAGTGQKRVWDPLGLQMFVRQPEGAGTWT